MPVSTSRSRGTWAGIAPNPDRRTSRMSDGRPIRAAAAAGDAESAGPAGPRCRDLRGRRRPGKDHLEAMRRERPRGRLDDRALGRRYAGQSVPFGRREEQLEHAAGCHQAREAARDGIVEAETSHAAASPTGTARSRQRHDPPAREAASPRPRGRTGHCRGRPCASGARRDVTPRPSPRRSRRCRGRGWWARGRRRPEPRDRHRCPRRSSPARGGQRDRRPSRRPPR